MLRDMRKLGGFVLSIVVIFSVGIWGLVSAVRSVKKTQAQSTASNAPMPAMPACPDSAGNHLNWVGGALVCGTSVAPPYLAGTTGSIGGGLLLAGACASGTAAVTGADPGDPVAVSASDGTNIPALGANVSGTVTSANTVTVSVCALVSVTPTAKTYTVKVLHF